MCLWTLSIFVFFLLTQGEVGDAELIEKWTQTLSSLFDLPCWLVWCFAYQLISGFNTFSLFFCCSDFGSLIGPITHFSIDLEGVTMTKWMLNEVFSIKRFIDLPRLACVSVHIPLTASPKSECLVSTMLGYLCIRDHRISHLFYKPSCPISFPPSRIESVKTLNHKTDTSIIFIVWANWHVQSNK